MSTKVSQAAGWDNKEVLTTPHTLLLKTNLTFTGWGIWRMQCIVQNHQHWKSYRKKLKACVQPSQYSYADACYSLDHWIHECLEVNSEHFKHFNIFHKLFLLCTPNIDPQWIIQGVIFFTLHCVYYFLNTLYIITCAAKTSK
jgi:hypothetical protein